MFILQRALKFAQVHFNVGEPSKHFCLLRCLDIVSPFMILERKRSELEIGFKTLCLSILFIHIVGLAYDILRQHDIRGALDIYSMLSVFVCIYVRPLCLRSFRESISAMDQLDANPRFRKGTPYGDAIRQQVVHKDNVYLGSAMAMHSFTVVLYIWHNLTTQNSFLTLVTYWPTDLSDVSPVLDKLAQTAYCLVAFLWGWSHAAGQVTIIVLLRIAVAEFRVFLESLVRLDEQIEETGKAYPELSHERIVCDLLHEHARRHQELIVVMMRLRKMLRIYTLVHFSLYMSIVATFMTRMLVITGASSLGTAVSLLATMIFFFETLGMCLLVEQLIQLNRKVNFALYSFDWPKCLPFGHAIKRTIMLMIMQSSNTNDFSAGGLTKISAELFAKSCRLVYTMMMCMANLANVNAE
ncbi:AGAP002046-PA-like protein [Anopheles sinensis]|uniref:AGAP002046-PA-like protein n=1 Tax=Anopheles sinensis TaxID=74873 RepID=A0A084VG45_ANOSI|nr:AGAP002046-PA-like protein [Anopheles sinensis]